MKKITVKTAKSMIPVFGSESQTFKNGDIIEVWSALTKKKHFLAKITHAGERRSQIERLDNGAISINSLSTSKKLK